MIEDSKEEIEDMPKYNPYSNEKYMYETRNNNFMIGSMLEFFMFFTPYILVNTFLFNKLFYILFDYKVSQWFRPYSFWLILLELLVQNNLQFFTFLGFRNLLTMFSFSFSSKAINGFFILFTFAVFITTIISYFIYYQT